MSTRVGAPYVFYNVDGFRGGLNKAVASFDLLDSELRDVKNVDFGLKGSIRPRAGANTYDVGAGDHRAGDRQTQIKNIFRYNQINGQREIVIQSERFIYNDSDTGTFANLVEMNQGDDGFIRFAQWRDTLFLLSKNDNVKTYHRGAFREARQASASGTLGGRFELIAFTGRFDGGLDPSLNYWYRFTFSRFHGDDFLCETTPIDNPFFDPQTGENFNDYFQIHDSASSIQFSSGSVNFPAGPDSLASLNDVRFINVYRSTARTSAIQYSGDAPNPQLQDPNFFFIGQFTRDNYLLGTFDLFNDIGQTPGNLIRYNKKSVPPRAKFAIMHKTRMWYANIGAHINNNANVDANPYGVYYSDLLEPEAVRALSTFDINPEDGEEITQIVSWKGKALFVFKDNSISAVFGGDNEAIDSLGRTSGVIDITIETVDEAVGCIAPDSLAKGEGGIMFLSNRGVYFFNGVQAVSLNSEIIEPFLDDIPSSMRNKAAGVYLNKERRYLLAISNQSVAPSKNSITLVYDFFTRTWTKYQYATDLGLGINKYVELKRGDEIGKLLATLQLSGSPQLTAGGTWIIDSEVEEFGVPLDWFATTKFFDCGKPHLVKKFTKLIVRYKSAHVLTIDYNIDEGRVVGTETIPLSGVHTWDKANLNWQGSPIEDDTHDWAAVTQAETVVPLPANLIGRRISLKFSGSESISGTEIQGLTIVYDPEPRVANDG